MNRDKPAPRPLRDKLADIAVGLLFALLVRRYGHGGH